VISFIVSSDGPYLWPTTIETFSDVTLREVRLPAKAFSNGAPSNAFYVYLNDRKLTSLSAFLNSSSGEIEIKAACAPGEVSGCTLKFPPYSRGAECNMRWTYNDDDFILKDASYRLTATYETGAQRTIRLNLASPCKTSTIARKPQSTEEAPWFAVIAAMVILSLISTLILRRLA